MQDYGFDTDVSEEAATTNLNLKSRPARQRLSFNAYFPAFPLDVETQILRQIGVQTCSGEGMRGSPISTMAPLAKKCCVVLSSGTCH
jgi:hypothetical protein